MRTYWLDLFTVETWNEFLAAGGEVSGFSEVRWKSVSQMKPGDYLLCYLVGGVSRWVGVLEVTSTGFTDRTPIWSAKVFPSRVRVRVVVQLTPETGIPVLSMRDQLSVFANLKNPNIWSGHFRGSPYKWKPTDGEAVLNAVMAAAASPVRRPLSKAHTEKRPALLESEVGQITLPEVDMTDDADLPEGGTREPTVHTEIQWLLLKLGVGMGYEVWVARNDRHRQWDGQKFSEVRGLRAKLPHQFDDLTTRVIELIDVLWLQGNSIVAAFEVESTTSIYSGLLRMADLLAMQPNISIPLFIVAPDERRNKVISEINRPTFLRLSPPLVDVCRFISFSALRGAIDRAAEFIRYLRPEYLQELSESCEGEPPD